MRVFILKEGLVRADHLGVFVEACPYARAEPDQPFDPLGRKKGVAEDVLRLTARCGPRGRLSESGE